MGHTPWHTFLHLRCIFNTPRRVWRLQVDRVDQVLLSAVGSVGLHLCAHPLVPQPWRRKIGSHNTAKKSRHPSRIDLSHEPLDANLHLQDKDKYLTFEARYIKRPSLRLLLGDTWACNTLRLGFHLWHHLRLLHQTTCPSNTTFHHRLPRFHHHHLHLDFFHRCDHR